VSASAVPDPISADRDPLAAARRLEGAGGREVLAEASRQAGAELERAELRSIHHRSGRSVSRVYDTTLRVGDATQEALLIAHVDARALPDGTFVLESNGDRVAVWRFPYDPFLPGLPSVIDASRVRQLLDQLQAPAGEVELFTRAYRPSRRAVVEVTIHLPDLSGRILYLKVLAGDRAEELAQVHRALLPHVPVPRVVGVAPRQGILAIEALAGRTMRAALVDGEDLPEPGAVVELSERLAASGLTSRRDPRAFADPVRHVPGLTSLVPDLADEVARVADAAADVDGDRVPVHGDLHDGQLLLTDGAISGLLDVDGSGSGLVAQDAGSLVAHVEAIGLVWPTAAERASAYAAALTDAYRPRVGATELARATAGAWIALATGPYRAQEVDWPEATRYRIRRAAQVLAEA
jgi:hypothetical protein